MNLKERSRLIHKECKADFVRSEVCPWCKRQSFRLGSLDCTELPKAGDYMVCSACFGLSEWTQWMTLIKSSTDDPEVLADIEKMKRLALKTAD